MSLFCLFWRLLSSELRIATDIANTSSSLAFQQIMIPWDGVPQDQTWLSKDTEQCSSLTPAGHSSHSSPGRSGHGGWSSRAQKWLWEDRSGLRRCHRAPRCRPCECPSRRAPWRPGPYTRVMLGFCPFFNTSASEATLHTQYVAEIITQTCQSTTKPFWCS